MDIGSIIDAIVDAFVSAFYFIISHPQYIIIILAAIIIYAVVNHVFFKVKGYQPQDKAVCTLSIAGKERSLDYLRGFTHVTEEQIAAIDYLRKNEPVPLSALSKRFGKRNVQILIRQGYIILT
jgi:hypothetical protein